ncbi:galactokinase [Salinispira pacifica]
MTQPKELQKRIEAGALDERFASLYGSQRVDDARKRYLDIIGSFASRFGSDREILLVSAPGRTELGGNHTDHNNGRVLAGSVHLDCVAAVAPRTDSRAVLHSEGYESAFEVSLNRLEPVADEEGDTTALLRGVARGFADRGLAVGGYDAYVSSRVLPGSGLSSSAAVEVAVGTIMSHLSNGGRVDPVTIARIGQFAENRFFGKPCGLMDQTACAYGGIIAIDFADPSKPVIEQVSYSFEAAGFRLMVVDTGGSHADLTPDYAGVPNEMKQVAAALGGSVLRDTTLPALLSRIAGLRTEAGDRAILRALHYFADNDRVERQIQALRGNDIAHYLSLVRESSDSSWRLLQNCYSTQEPKSQGIPLAIAATDLFLRGLLGKTTEAQTVPGGAPGAARVHGGGFAGTAQVYVPLELESEYIAVMESIFGGGCVTSLSIRTEGAAVVA